MAGRYTAKQLAEARALNASFGSGEYSDRSGRGYNSGGRQMYARYESPSRFQNGPPGVNQPGYYDHSHDQVQLPPRREPGGEFDPGE